MAKAKENGSRNADKTLKGILARKDAPKIGFVLLLGLYLVTSVFVLQTSHSEGVVLLAGQPIPLRSLTGAFSSVANLCIVFLVLLYGKPGFIVSLALLVVQFPNILGSMIIERNYTNIPGLFSTAFAIVAIVLIYVNNNQIRKYQKKIVDQAVTDRLTGLPNRFACSELLDDLVEDGGKFIVAFFNLNNFKSINSTMGQATGNDVLVEIASRLKGLANSSETGTNDFVTYQGSDEFALVVRDYRTDQDAVNTLKRYESAIAEKITLDDCDYFVTASIGYAEYPADAQDADTLMSHADVAMHKAKTQNSTDRLCRFTSDMLDAERAVEVERKIRMALENDTLYFHLQPQYDMSHKLIGFEALARMKDDDGNVISPGEFIPVAEQAGLVDKIDVTVFKKSAKFFGELIKKTHTDITLSVNVSVKHLMKNDFIAEFTEILNTCGVPANQLEIEITESIMIDSVEGALHCIEEVKSMGVKIAIDDFGAGYSSLSYLNDFPGDMLKVDKSFIDKMNLSDSSRQYVAAIISIGHVMNFSVISEGVEQSEQLEVLRNIGCDYIQGFIWGRPMEPAEAEELVVQQAA